MLPRNEGFHERVRLAAEVRRGLKLDTDAFISGHQPVRLAAEVRRGLKLSSLKIIEKNFLVRLAAEVRRGLKLDKVVGNASDSPGSPCR